MTHELRIERLVNATPDVVFGAFVDPESQEEIFSEAGMPSGYSLLVFEIDLRVGGTWIIVLGPEEGAPDRVRNVFTEINRPRRLAYQSSMFVSEWGRTVDSTVTMTFEEQDGKTLLTYVQAGFETKEDRDSFQDGVPGFLDAVAAFVARATGAVGASGDSRIVEGGR